MSFLEGINADITAAMRAQDKARLGTLRLLKTALVNREVEKGRALDTAEALQVVASLVKQRRDSIEQFSRGGRQDLVDKEQHEIELLETYLPPAATRADIEAAIDDAIRETGATTPRDLGPVMKAVMARLAGRTADGKAVSELIRNRLSG